MRNDIEMAIIVPDCELEEQNNGLKITLNFLENVFVNNPIKIFIKVFNGIKTDFDI